jgi:hypothetical protein
MFLPRIFHRTIPLAFASLLVIVGSMQIDAQELDSTKILEKSGKKPRYQLKKTSSITQKPKSPFAIYALPQLKSGIRIKGDSVLQERLLGDFSLSPVHSKSFSDYSLQQNSLVNRSFWNAYSKSLDGSSSVQSRGLFPKIELPPAIDRIFGGSEV